MVTVEVADENERVNSGQVWAEEVTVEITGRDVRVDVRVAWRDIATLFAQCGDMAAREALALRDEGRRLKEELAATRGEFRVFMDRTNKEGTTT